MAAKSEADSQRVKSKQTIKLSAFNVKKFVAELMSKCVTNPIYLTMVRPLDANRKGPRVPMNGEERQRIFGMLSQSCLQQ